MFTRVVGIWGGDIWWSEGEYLCDGESGESVENRESARTVYRTNLRVNEELGRIEVEKYNWRVSGTDRGDITRTNVCINVNYPPSYEASESQ